MSILVVSITNKKKKGNSGKNKTNINNVMKQITI